MLMGGVVRGYSNVYYAITITSSLEWSLARISLRRLGTLLSVVSATNDEKDTHRSYLMHDSSEGHTRVCVSCDRDTRAVELGDSP